MTITATTSVRTMSVMACAEPVSLSQVFVDIFNGVALGKVDTKIKQLQSRLNHPAMASHHRRAALIGDQIVKLQAERLFIARTMSAHLS